MYTERIPETAIPDNMHITGARTNMRRTITPCEGERERERERRERVERERERKSKRREDILCLENFGAYSKINASHTIQDNKDISIC